MKLRNRIMNRLRRSHRRNRIMDSPLEMGRLSAWYNLNDLKDHSKGQL